MIDEMRRGRFPTKEEKLIVMLDKLKSDIDVMQEAMCDLAKKYQSVLEMLVKMYDRNEELIKELENSRGK